MDVGHMLLKPLSSFRPTSRCPASLVEGVTVHTSALASGDCLDVEVAQFVAVTPRPHGVGPWAEAPCRSLPQDVHRKTARTPPSTLQFRRPVRLAGRTSRSAARVHPRAK